MGLVLNRRLGECIQIGPDVVVEVIEIRPQSVRLSVIAPRAVEVHRKEISDAIALTSMEPKGGPR